MKRAAIFQTLHKDQIELLSPLFEEFTCQPGKVIFQQGERAEFFYLVIKGIVEMSFKPYDGIPITISHVGKGDLFGWSAVIGNGTYTSTALAMEAVEAFRVRGSELRKFCLEHPQAGKDILERLAAGVAFRWRDADHQVKSMLVQGMTEKLGIA